MTHGDEWQQAQVALVGRAVRELRGTRSTQWVSDRTEELGLRVNRSTITDLEIGRRKYVALHEISLLAAALGVPPTVLLTWGSLPDGEVETLPGRVVPADQAVAWWGGALPSPFHPATSSLPRDTEATELLQLTEQREEVRRALLHAHLAVQTTGSAADPALTRTLADQLAGITERMKALGGVVAGDEDVDHGSG